MTASPDFDLTEMLKKIYIEPIQSIVIIDDDYKTLWDMQNTEQETVEEKVTDSLSASAQEDDDLYGELTDSKSDAKREETSHGEITVGPPDNTAQKIMTSCKDEFILHVDNRPEIPNKIIEKADFLILDYYLTNDENPEHSIKILNKYIEREKFSPIIIHSSEDYETILRDVLPKIENSTKQNKENCIYGEGFFVVILNKITDDMKNINHFFDILLSKMSENPPTPLFILAQSFINSIAKQSEKISRAIFSDSATRSGILFDTFSHGVNLKCKKHEYNLRYGGLLDRILEDVKLHVNINVNDEISLFFSKIKNNTNIYSSDLRFAKIAEKTDSSDIDVMLKLNSHLCSKNHNFDYITNGTILKSEDNNYYLCTTPSCDTVPERKKKKCQREFLKHANYFLGTLLTPVIKAKKISESLEKAEQGRHIFILEGNDVKVLEVLTSGNQLFPYIFYAQNSGYIDINTNEINLQYSIFCSDTKSLILKNETMLVVGQLRKLYASSFLQRFGMHNSRIGMDFKKYPLR